MTKVKSRTSLGLLTTLMFVVIFVTTKLQYEHVKVENRWHPFVSTRGSSGLASGEDRFESLDSLRQGVVEWASNLELKPLWQSSSLNCNALLAIPVGIKQKQNVDIMVQKFLSENCSILLFHYDGSVDGWNDLEWSNKAVHILAHNQTKWWFAKRFLHPDVVSPYDFIFLWDEDLGVENFHPGRFLEIMISEGLEISQPALDPELSEVHHRITLRNKTVKVHRQVYVSRGSFNCSDNSTGPPCTGWVEGMAPVFSRAAWHCVWHLIQNDLIHGWGLDMKLGYCAQGDPTKTVGVIDSEYIVHRGIPTLGGASATKPPPDRKSPEHSPVKSDRSIDLRTHIRRQSTAELEIFKQRWDQAVREDDRWIDPFYHLRQNGELHEKHATE
ncbi:PREDICTED: uncharacterized protein LOC104610123 isoform X2 [Nelumbo nucifera]|uniref:Uncharacterized protein LOC104610123 isoform X2 n=1 Tax=Nelumbo nucifera TaxID=4432 RepID=A0A1U8BET5_NELNU|nr:PREDICTED: uncharacterized protein LOC104610123 isoform X2 [Nelumbo nucifera]